MAQQWNDDSSSSEEDNVIYAMAVLMHDNLERQIEYATQCANQPKHGGTSSRRTTIPRDRVGAHNILMNNYFANPPLYPPYKFREKFRMRRELFIRIMEEVVNFDDYFKQKPDAAGKLGFSPEVKMTADMRMLAYGTPADANDEYLKIAQTTSFQVSKRFCRAINAVFGQHYLRKPTKADLRRLLAKAEERGFPGMVGSLDCMHWECKNCPVAYHGAYTGHHRRPTIVLEAVASYDTWIWHAYFGPPGSCNDLNVLYRSPLFNDVLEGRASLVGYVVNGIEHNQGYYLADGIYPKWSTIVQTITDPQGHDKKVFAKLQEVYRKDVERTFGILQARFAIVRGPSRQWFQEDLSATMKAYIILHNMIVEDEREAEGDDFVDDPTQYHVEDGPIQPGRNPLTIGQYINNRNVMADASAHYALRNNLIEYVYNKYRSGAIQFMGV